MRRLLPLAALFVLATSGAASAIAAQQPAPDAPVLTLTASTTLDPAVVYGGLVIAASGITVDGRGARVVGPVQRAAEAAGQAAATNAFTGVGVRASGVDGVTLKNLRVQGFETGLLVEDGAGWRVQDCDLSDEFHDPDFGWGELGEKGGLVLRRVRGSQLVRVRANRCWNGCSLVDCEDDGLRDCDLSHSSNVCLKLWHATGCEVQGNDLSWGLRIAPGETHARDSACVLIESGSDGNLFERNDATHGGDGIFIRVLNNWTSRRNAFHANDVSWAHNNGFEAWSPENSYENNRANHCSYGFWLGASDETVLLGNEAGWNGDPDGFHNAPESFGHGGIVFVNGPSNHTTVDGNWLHHNAGGGVVLRGDEASDGQAFKAWHWIIQRNRFESNRWGVWMRHADFIDIGPNAFRDNRDGDVFDAGDVSGVVRHEGSMLTGIPPQIDAHNAEFDWAADRCETDARVDVEAKDETGFPPGLVTWRWGFGDGTLLAGPGGARASDGSVMTQLEHEYAKPGWYRIGVTATYGGLSSMRWLEVFCRDKDAGEQPAIAAPESWALVSEGNSRATFASDDCCLGDKNAIHAHIEPYDGRRVSLLWPATRDAALSLTHRAALSFWIRTRNPNIPAWQDNNPVVTLFQSADRWLQLTPTRDLLGNPTDVQFRDGWMPIEVPLAGGDGWTRETGPAGAPDVANWITIGVDSWGAPPLDVWLDGLVLRSAP